MKNKKSKKPVTVTIEDYRPMVVKYPYDRKFKFDYSMPIRKKDCDSLNNIARNRNIVDFNIILHQSLIYFLNRKNISRDDLKALLGGTLREVGDIFDESKFSKSVNFKLIYDVCCAINVSIEELVERMEREF